MEFVESERGQQKLCHQSYVYVKQKNLANGVVSWECERRRKYNCTAKLKVRGDELVGQVNTHNHSGDPARKEVIQVQTAIKRRALDTEETAQQILSTVAVNVSDSAAAQLPPIRHMRRGVRRLKKDAGNPLPVPPNLQAMEIPQEYKVTHRDEPFLLYDSGTDSPNRILIFSTETNLRALTTTGHWFSDGTFKTAPELFYQIYTIHALVDKNILPCVYALLPNKTEETYYQLFQQLLILKPNLHPISVMVDFEIGARNALVRVFPQADIKGCFFHLSQCVYRKVQEKGHQQRYQNDGEFNLCMKMIPALAFVPVADLEEAFETLAEDIGDDCQDILDYFEDNYIGRPGRRQRRDPKFSHEMWNMHHRTVEELPRTNNNIEGWHRGFQSSIGGCHPNIWTFLGKLKRQQALHHLQLTQILAGDVIPQRKKYQDTSRRILNLVQNYGGRHVLDFLRGVAYNVRM